MLSDLEYPRCLKWLTENASFPVKYLVYKNILGEDPENETMLNLWNRILDDPLSRYIFEKQKPDGSWFTGGSWHATPSYIQKSGYTPVSPKYVTTVWVLKILGDMGYTIKDPRVKKSLDWVFTWQLDNGVITEDRRLLTKVADPHPINSPCRMNIMMDCLARIGASSDPRFQLSIKRLVDWQRADGGWLNEGHRDATLSPYKVWNRSCPWSSFFATSALYNSKLTEYKDTLRNALKFQIWHLEQKQEDDVRKVFYHGHETIQEMIMLSDLKVGLESLQFKNLLQWFEEMYDFNRGHFVYSEQKPEKSVRKSDKVSKQVLKYRSFHQTEDDWLTYNIMRVELNMKKMGKKSLSDFN